MWTLDDGKFIHIVIEKVWTHHGYIHYLIIQNPRLIKWNGGVELSNLIRR
jgi:hypothetical protein